MPSEVPAFRWAKLKRFQRGNHSLTYHHTNSMTFITNLLWTIQTIGMSEDERHEFALNRNALLITQMMAAKEAPGASDLATPPGIADDEWVSVFGHVYGWHGREDEYFTTKENN